MKQRFVVKQCAVINKDKVQIYGEFLWNIKKDNGNVLTPHVIVEKAKSKNSPIHDHFEWNDSVAGEKYRLWQARYLINQIHIVVENAEGDEESIRAFHNISIKYEENEEDNERGYVTVEEVKDNPDYLAIIISKAHDELLGWQQKYAQYRNLSKFRMFEPVFRTIRKTTKEVQATI